MENSDNQVHSSTVNISPTSKETPEALSSPRKASITDILIESKEPTAIPILPFDLVLFRGTDMVSNLVLATEQLATKNSQFSHIGIVITKDVCPFIKELKEDVKYLIESTANLTEADGPKDINDKRKFGVQIRELDAVVNEYKGKVYCGHLTNNPYPDNPYSEEMQNVYNNYYNRLYEANCLDLCAAAFKWCRPLREEFNKVQIVAGKLIMRNFDARDPDGMVYCSQLAAIILKTIGVLPNTIDERDYLPIDVLGIRDGYPNIIHKLETLK